MALESLVCRPLYRDWDISFHPVYPYAQPRQMVFCRHPGRTGAFPHALDLRFNAGNTGSCRSKTDEPAADCKRWNCPAGTLGVGNVPGAIALAGAGHRAATGLGIGLVCTLSSFPWESTHPIYPIVRVIPREPSFRQTFTGIFRIIMQVHRESPG